jgi:hypothetical protein
MKACGGVDVYIHVFLTLALDSDWSDTRSERFTLGERAPGTHWIGGWVGLRAGLYSVAKVKYLTLPELELQPVGSSYMDSAIPALVNWKVCEKKWP